MSYNEFTKALKKLEREPDLVKRERILKVAITFITSDNRATRKVTDEDFNTICDVTAIYAPHQMGPVLSYASVMSMSLLDGKIFGIFSNFYHYDSNFIHFSS